MQDRDILELRSKIDLIDKELARLYQERMDVVADVAAFKKASNKPVLDPARERSKLAEVASMVRPELRDSIQRLYSMMFELSRNYQKSLNQADSPLHAEVQHAIESTPQLFPVSAAVACQGVEGAYSQIACERLFKRPQIMYFKTFESVFSAIESGFCRYGMLPIENSSAGSVKQVYDLMMKHNFKIVRSVRLKVDHTLLAKKGTKITDITEVFSHEQAISQCAGYLEKLGVKITRCENTAQAAEAVANSGRSDVAAISSHNCAALYGLSVLASDIQDRSNNYTRFICISKELEIYPGADKTSVMMTLPHRPGSLCHALSRFYSLGINLIKLESRPIPEHDFEFMFYFDLETSIYSEEFVRLIDDLNDISEEFRYLGSYTEVI